MKLLTSSQVARRLELSAERVRQLARQGRLPAAQETPLGRLWDAEAVERFAVTRGRWGRYDALATEEGRQ